MFVVLFLIFAWFNILIMVTLPRKLPMVVNFLLFMVIEVVLTNKLTIIGFNYELFEINTSIPHFLSLILHNDFTITFVLLTFANVFLTARRAWIRWGISLYTFSMQLFLGLELRWNEVLFNREWNTFMESVMIVVILAYTLFWGYVFQKMAAKEGWVR
ncbi:hypothetical protein [Paenibacillus turpanensis]|uniref:hypothetical protein n=1 Tax=Paenibacillus turpanensis TaxID=2689078 RepID=UPI00140B3C6C|nr:hypothetical protein [Paenibacillus turpanensis]